MNFKNLIIIIKFKKFERHNNGFTTLEIMKCGGWWVEGEAAGDEASFYNGAAKKKRLCLRFGRG